MEPMKAILIGLLGVMVLTFGFMIYNHVAETPGNGAVEKVEVLRVDAKHKLEKREKDDDEDKNDKDDKDKDDKDDEKEDEKEKNDPDAADSLNMKKTDLGIVDSSTSKKAR